MTLFEPSLRVSRLLIMRGDLVAYDEKFHRGVNIIRGENSSGKSTVLNALFYALGGDLSLWSEHAALCTRVIAEVYLNGKPATFSRDISLKPGQPMEIYAGEWDVGSRAPVSDWYKYPYARSQSRISFSQAIFRMLGIPEAANESSGNITIHQVLRLLYADQLTPPDSIFRYDGRFDSPLIRDAVGRLLCGTYGTDIYAMELKRRELDKEFEAVSGELRSLISILNVTDQTSALDWVAASRTQLEEERRKLTRQIQSEEGEALAAAEVKHTPSNARANAYVEFQLLQQNFSSAREDIERTRLEVDDSSAFIDSLESKLKALQDARLTLHDIGEVQFQYCPVCYSSLDHDGSETKCHLCKADLDRERSKSRILYLINELSLQLQQSQELQKKRKERLSSLESKFTDLRDRLARSQRQLEEIETTVSSERDFRLRELSKRIGYIDRQLEDLTEKVKLAELLRNLSEKKAGLAKQISDVDGRIQAARVGLERRLSIAYTRISDATVALLKKDLKRQDSFDDPKSIQFDFEKNRISVDGHTYFSASSQAILKNCFFAGFLEAATQEEFFRHPRFCMIDTIEDKGVEQVRSQNFQRVLVDMSNSLQIEHQIIFATAMIAPELDVDTYTVGRASTRENRTLNIAT